MSYLYNVRICCRFDGELTSSRRRDRSISSFFDETDQRNSIITITELDRNPRELKNSLTMEVLENLAISCLQDSVKRSNTTTICLIIRNVFEYLDKHDKWIPNHVAIECFRVIMASFQAQYSYVLVSQVVSHLDKNIQALPRVKSSIISVLAHIVAIDKPSVGLSILELLSSLLRHLSLSVYRMTLTTYANTAIEEETHLQQIIVETIGMC